MTAQAQTQPLRSSSADPGHETSLQPEVGNVAHTAGLGVSEELPIQSVGGKAHSLGRLSSLGLPVPGGFVIATSAFRDHLRRLGWVESWDDVQSVAPAQLAEIRQSIVDAPIEAQLLREIEVAVRTHCSLPLRVAVRSSAIGEDGGSSSFAGQFESFLDISTLEELSQAVRRCWASAWVERALQYGGRARRAQNDMAVVVQDMVAAQYAGVLFTINPVTGNEDEYIVESVPGLAEGLVSGQVDGRRIVLGAASGDVLQDADAGRDPLPPGLLPALFDAARIVQAHWGRPMDIEWCFDGELKLVQARPVTSVGSPADGEEWTTADFRDGGVSSSICSSYMWSLYRLAFSESMPRYFKELRLIARDHEAEWVRLIYGRPYWSASEVKRALRKIPGYCEDSFDRDLGIEPDPGVAGEKTPTTVRTVLAILPTLFALKRSYRSVLAANQELAAEFETLAAPYDLSAEALSEMDHEAFAERYRTLIEEFYRRVETSYFTTIYNTANAKLDLNSALEKAEKATGLCFDQLALMSGLTDLSHLRPMRDLYDLSERLARERSEPDDEVVEAFARRWKHHSRRELDIRVPRWEDDLPFVRDLLRSAVQNFREESDPRRGERLQVQRYELERERLRRMLRRRPLFRSSLLKKLQLARRYMWWREEMRDYSSHAYYLVRKWAVCAGRRLASLRLVADPDEVWHLEALEVAGALSGELSPAQVRDRIDERTLREACFRNFPCPDEIGTRQSRPALPAHAEGGELRGTACSAGLVIGTSRVVESVSDVGSVQPGEILITRFTDPGWTPAFAHIGGVVTETGGMLSHAAVISREYGIPAVLGVAGATREIRSGDRVCVDGNRGLVSVLGEG